MKTCARLAPEELNPLAALVAGYAPPPWLTEFFSAWSSSLFLDRRIYEIQPTRSQVFRALKRMLVDIRGSNASAQIILDNVASSELLAFLRFDERKKDLDAKGLQVTLFYLDAWVSEALNSEELAGKWGGARMGRGRAMPPGALASKDFCALTVAQAWHFCRGDWPKPRSRKACKAAEMFWRMAGGDAHSFGEEPYASWRCHLARSEKVAGVQALRSELRRHLLELERFQNMQTKTTDTPPQGCSTLFTEGH